MLPASVSGPESRRENEKRRGRRSPEGMLKSVNEVRFASSVGPRLPESCVPGMHATCLPARASVCFCYAYDCVWLCVSGPEPQLPGEE